MANAARSHIGTLASNTRRLRREKTGESAISRNSSDLDLDLSSIIGLAQQQLTYFARSQGFISSITVAFGERADASAFRVAWQNKDFSDFPPIEIRNRVELNGANGAFAEANGKIYLSKEFIEANLNNNAKAIVSVLLEEYGHYLDAKLNNSDSDGDEGNIFAKLVQGKKSSQAELNILKSEDDTGFISVDGITLRAEFNSGRWGGVWHWWWYVDDDWNSNGYIVGNNDGEAIGGWAGNDTIFGNGGNDIIHGDEDNDTLYGGTGSDKVFGDDGNDIIRVWNADHDGVDYLNGGWGNDTLDFSHSDKSVKIGIDDGPISDRRVSFYFTHDGDTKGAVLPVVKIGDNDNLMFWSMEKIIGSLKDDCLRAGHGWWPGGFQNFTIDTIDGNDGNDQLYALGHYLVDGQSVTITLKGGRGNDFLTADLDPNDKRTIVLDGGEGSDVFILAESMAKKEEDIAGKIARAGLDVALAMASLPTFGNTGATVSAIGSSIARIVDLAVEIGSIPNMPQNPDSDDLVQIKDFTFGEDVIVLPNLQGNESYNFLSTGHSEFFIQLKQSNTSNFTNIARVYLSEQSKTQYLYKGLPEKYLEDVIMKTFKTNDKDYIIGDLYINNATNSNFGLRLVSSNFSDLITGGSGDDNIESLGGKDTLIGGKGNDSLNGGDGEDTADYSTSPKGVNVTLDSGWMRYDATYNAHFNDGFDSKDYLYYFENLTGSNHDDVLNGENYDWSNVINGLAGNDTISGKGGNDTLIGGAGNDTLNGGNGVDWVKIDGSRMQFELDWTGTNQFVIKDNIINRHGVDSLIDVERLQFNDAEVTLFDNGKWFSPSTYLLSNPDLRQWLRPNDFLSAATHYIRHGFAENRPGVFA